MIDEYERRRVLHAWFGAGWKLSSQVLVIASAFLVAVAAIITIVHAIVGG